MIYLDNNATTLVDERVVEKMVELLRSTPGNPSSSHHYGQEAVKVMTRARQTMADLLGVSPRDLVFTSGGTESINLAIQGILAASPGHVISTDLEHAAVYNTLRILEARGVPVTYLKPGATGAATPASVAEAIRPETRLIVLMAVNNETGIKTDVEGIARVAQEHAVPFVVDGVAWIGKDAVAIPSGVSALCLSGHKIHGPKGVGALFLRKGTPFVPLCGGGPQERGRRPGTENVAGIAAMAEALSLCYEVLPEAVDKMRDLRDFFEETLCQQMGNVVVHGKGRPRICNTSNIAFTGIDGESLLIQLDLQGVMASHGSACSSGALEPSRVLLNMGISREEASSSLRFSFSRMTTREEIEKAVKIIVNAVTGTVTSP